MVLLVSGDTAVDAWKAGCSVLFNADGGEVFNLITEIRHPTRFDPRWYKVFSPQSVGEKDSLSVVAKVLFPGIPRAARETRADYYDRCQKVLKRGRQQHRLSRPSWGTSYFERLCGLDGSDNQIERAINVLNNWTHSPKAAIVMHLSSPKTDKIMKIGAPCLQYIEILVESGERLNLFAVYRNHHFLSKALGNFIGLGRLLEFIASETDKKVGRIVCHSAHAEVGKKLKLKALSSRTVK